MAPTPPLFDALPRLASRVAWRELGEFPTAVERLGGAGLGPGGEDLEGLELWAKREDRSSPIYGGNKLRKLEFLLATAAEGGAERVVTIGRYGSHHVLAVGVWARRCGLGVDGVVYPQAATPHVLDNLRADLALGVRLHPQPSFARAFLKLQTLSLRRRSFRIPGGGSTPLGNLGFVSAAFELRAQIDSGACPRFDDIYVPAGTGGTAAGLWVGLRLAGLGARLTAVEAVRRKRVSTRDHIVAHARALVERYDLELDLRDPGADLRVESGFYAPGYGEASAAALEACELGRSLGLGLDTTYTSKAFAALVDHARRGQLRGRKVLFLSTCSCADLEPLLAAGPGPEAMPASLAHLFDGDHAHAQAP